MLFDFSGFRSDFVEVLELCIPLKAYFVQGWKERNSSIKSHYTSVTTYLMFFFASNAHLGPFRSRSCYFYCSKQKLWLEILLSFSACSTAFWLQWVVQKAHSAYRYTVNTVKLEIIANQGCGSRLIVALQQVTSDTLVTDSSDNHR